MKTFRIISWACYLLGAALVFSNYVGLVSNGVGWIGWGVAMLGWLVISFGPRLFRPHSGPEADKAAEENIRALHTTWIAAVNAGDLAHLLSLTTVDLVLLNPGGAPIGREGFSANFTDAHQRLRFECRSELEEVIVVGTVAYTRSRDSLSVTPRTGGPTTQFAGYRMTIYRQQPDGHWLLARDAHNLSPVVK